MDARVGDFVAGFGDLYRVADIWAGNTSEDASFLIENCSGRGWLFQWISQDDLERHFEEVGLV